LPKAEGRIALRMQSAARLWVIPDPNRRSSSRTIHDRAEIVMAALPLQIFAEYGHASRNLLRLLK